MPPGCEREGDTAPVPVLGRHCYERIRYPLGDAPPLVFLLIRPGQGNQLPFYIMRDKVSRQQFRTVLAGPGARDLLDRPTGRKLAAAAAVGVGAGGLYDVFTGRCCWAICREWEKAGPDPAAEQLPVMNVTVMEAHCFARCVGGKLPTEAQWLKAAGFYDEQAGPCKKNWKPGGIALNREAPAAVGTSADDESIFLCRDMAGNGREWTRDEVNRDDRTDPFSQPRKSDRFTLRGHSFREGVPFLFKKAEPETEQQGVPLEDTSFRVVIEIPVGS
jgi:formylglycine-generating enzyme required for sulfatase activity